MSTLERDIQHLRQVFINFGDFFLKLPAAFLSSRCGEDVEPRYWVRLTPGHGGCFQFLSGSKQ